MKCICLLLSVMRFLVHFHAFRKKIIFINPTLPLCTMLRKVKKKSPKYFRALAVSQTLIDAGTTGIIRIANLETCEDLFGHSVFFILSSFAL